MSTTDRTIALRPGASLPPRRDGNLIPFPRGPRFDPEPVREGGASPGARILCVQSEPAVAAWIEDTLERSGHDTHLAARVADALAALAEHPFDLVVTDSSLPDGTDFDLLRHLRDDGRDVPVMVLAADVSADHAVLALRHGAVNCLLRPMDPETLLGAVDSAIARHIPDSLVKSLLRELGSPQAGPRAHRHGGCSAPAPAASGLTRPIIGTSRSLREALELIELVAAPRATVLLEGESGTGKELFARAIHEWSPRRAQPFVAINCAVLPEALAESVLFGHERGAFTGAIGRTTGAFERAHRGTLLLDEISEMRPDLQAKLLRAIQELEIERVGGSQPIPVDVRIVATTNRDLGKEVAAGRFRPDLYYRLHVVPIRVPPLRERIDDIPALVEHFVDTSAAAFGVRAPEVPEETLRYLASQPWPGNVRELQNAVQRAVILCRDTRLTPRAFGAGSAESGTPARAPVADRSAQSAEPIDNAATASIVPRGALALPEGTFDLESLERHAIARALESTQGHRARAARLLGISERTLRTKLNGPLRVAA